ncbi:hypothetical protein KXD40_003534 [Peronospora effusa]|uniref:Alkyl transferase n=1 Tax=Peronospora effusa TaxID=542832 RepID=A0A3M6VUU4_9STRA|nr:hypothetical protein DD238_001804 [Peronospora effusa]UIZ22978.1 hypothetical protein KXD40_003534 [Peronospora effusa]
MDENASGIVWQREHIGRNTLSQIDGGMGATSDLELVRSFYNGFEMWWLAGMPITLVFVLTLLSFSLVSGFSGLEKSKCWRRILPVPILRLVGWLSGPLNADYAGLERKKTRSSMLRGELKIPGHIAVIMDGNRRYGKEKYGEGVRGHSDGSRTLVNFTEWCIDAGIKVLTVFAFSTENWDRKQAEVDALMTLFNQFMHEIVPEALKRHVRVRVLVSDGRKLPMYIVEAIQEIETKTQHCTKFSLNLCVRYGVIYLSFLLAKVAELMLEAIDNDLDSYGARDEIVGACRKIATKVAKGETSVDDINEDLLSQHMLTAYDIGLPDPDILIRTSGELRISNFLLYQIAYSELIFMDKMWPEVTQDDVQGIILEFNRRKRRFGK